MPRFLVEELTAREAGESAVLALGDTEHHDLTLELEITHVKQQQEMDVEVYASKDGVNWPKRPATVFLEKMYCGTYKVVIPHTEARYLKAVWIPHRRGRQQGAPLFRFSLRVGTAEARAMAGAA